MSPWEAAADIAALWMRAPVLAGVYLGGMLDPMLRERIMVAVSRVNACAACTAVHERWALRAGAENRFRGAADRELARAGPLPPHRG